MQVLELLKLGGSLTTKLCFEGGCLVGNYPITGFPQVQPSAHGPRDRIGPLFPRHVVRGHYLGFSFPNTVTSG